MRTAEESLGRKKYGESDRGIGTQKEGCISKVAEL
jgi:hypothetical protein